MKIIRTYLAVLILVLLLAVFSWSFFQPNFFRVHDFTHVARLVELRRSLDAGQLPVHWSQNFGYGYGMPLFLFYGPLPAYFGAVLTYIGLPPLWAVKLTFAATGILAGTGMFVYLRRWGRSAAIAGAALVVAAPYRAVDLFVRGALNEVFAIGILPWLLHSLWKISEKSRSGFLWSALWTALLILTHNLTALMALPVLYSIAAARIVWQKEQRWLRLGYLAAAGIFGLVLSAFYAVPAFLEKNQTIIGEILSGYFDYHLHFLYIRQLIWPRWGYGGSEYGPNDGISFHLGWPLLAALVLTGLAWLWRNRRFHKQKRPEKDLAIGLLFLGGGGSLFLTLTHSLPLWEAIPLLPFIQFPWRWLGLAIVLLSAAAALGLSLVRRNKHRYLLTAVLVIAVIAGQLNYHRPEKFLTRDDDFYYSDGRLIRTQMSDILMDYLPNNFDRKLPPVDPEQRIAIDLAPQSTRWELNRPHELLMFAENPAGSTITWNIADFAGWKYYVNDRLVTPELLPDGRRQYQSNEAIKTVGARFGLTPLRSATLIVSFIGWIIFAASWLGKERRQHD
jgi:hypothetical protein